MRLSDISETLFSWLSLIVLNKADSIPRQAPAWREREWEIARSVMIIHGLGPLWGWMLKEGWTCEIMPENIRTFLIRQYTENEMRLNRIREMMSEFDIRFKEAGISYLPFKGLTIADTIYDNPGVRPMSDIDIFINRNDMDRALLLFKRAGYIPKIVAPYGVTLIQEAFYNSLPDRHKRISQNDTASLILSGKLPEPPVEVDLQTRILAQPGGVDLIFNRALMEGWRRLDPESALLYMAVHAAKHILSNSCRWIQMYDLMLMEQSLAANAGRLADRAEESGAAHLIYLAITLCRKYFPLSFMSLSTELAPLIKRRFKRRAKNVTLTQNSYCNPYLPSLVSTLLWMNDVNETKKLIHTALGKKKTSRALIGGSLVSPQTFPVRIFHRIKE